MNVIGQQLSSVSDVMRIIEGFLDIQDALMLTSTCKKAKEWRNCLRVENTKLLAVILKRMSSVLEVSAPGLVFGNATMEIRKGKKRSKVNLSEQAIYR